MLLPKLFQCSDLATVTKARVRILVERKHGYMGKKRDVFLILRVLVIRKVDSAIHRTVIFQLS